MVIILIRKLLITFLLFLFALKVSSQQGLSDNLATTGANPEGSPVLRWTAGSDPMNFRYDFLDNIRNVSLYKAIPETGTFSHHGHIILFKGVVYAYWDKQIKDENGSGQHGVYCYSADQGVTWSAPLMLFPPHDHMVPAEEAYIGRRFQTANGFAVVEDVLYAVSDVADWTGPSIEQRERISIGRIFRSVNDGGRLGEIFWLTDKAPAPVKGFSSYPAGDPGIVKKIIAFFGQPGHEIQLNFTTPHPVSDDNHRLIEPVPSWRLADGTCVRLYRDGGARDAKTSEEVESTKSWRNYASFSFDDGMTWTVPIRTSFPDACSRTNAGRLPDGQYYVINNVLPLSTKYGGRSLLAISLSRDGLVFDRMAVIRFLPPAKRYEGRAKSAGFAYPHSVVVGDTLMVLYSVNKEDMHLSYLPLQELYNIK